MKMLLLAFNVWINHEQYMRICMHLNAELTGNLVFGGWDEYEYIDADGNKRIIELSY